MHLPDYNPDLSSISGMIVFMVSVFMMLFCFISLVSLPFSAILATRRFDPIFRNNSIHLLCLGRLVRGCWYSHVMVMPRWIIRKGSLADRTFQGYDLWSSATRLERVFACIHIYSALLCVLGMVGFVIMYVIYLFQIY